jgi:cell division septal protein FtsQ
MTDAVRPPSRGVQWAMVAAIVAALALISLPSWGRYLAFFNVREVEVRGTRFVRGEDILKRLATDTTHSVWERTDSLEARVKGHPQVRDAVVRRRLPGKLIVEIEENLPVALVPGARGLRAYDEEGRVLPIDLTRTGPDLPIAERADTALLHLLADLGRERPSMFAQISEVRVEGKEQLRFIIGGLQVLLMRGHGVERFDELSSVQRDLARRRLVPVELDLRFKDQVIARFP